MFTASGERKTPHLFAIIDDCSRVCCHAQWYEDEENSEDLVHGFCQGIQKRRVPRATNTSGARPSTSFALVRAGTSVRKPVEAPILAMAGLKTVQVPPAVASLKVEVPPMHTVISPVIAGGFGSTVITTVVKQPVGNV